MTFWKKSAIGAACVSLVGLAATAASGSEHGDAWGGRWPFEAEHARPPTLENKGGGPVVAAPRVVPVLFASDPLLADLTAFYAKLGTSAYLRASTGEYGVGQATILPPVVRPDAPPAEIDDFAASDWLLGQIASGALPAEDGNTVYSLVYPSPSLVIGGGLSLGYSYQLCGAVNETATAADGSLVPFTLSGRCPGITPLGDVDAETSAQAQGLVNAFTAPDSWIAPAYNDVSWSGSAFTMFFGTWAGTLCSLQRHEPTTTRPADLGYLVPIAWSNVAALGGHDPCAARDAPRSVYFNAAPDLTGTATPYGMVKGLTLPPGGQATIPVRLFSDGPTAAWTLAADERTDVLYDPDNLLTFSFDATTGKNGDVRALTVHRAAAPDGSVAPLLGFEITSTLGSVTHEWLVLVGAD